MVERYWFALFLKYQNKLINPNKFCFYFTIGVKKTKKNIFDYNLEFFCKCSDLSNKYIILDKKINFKKVQNILMDVN